MPGGFIGEFLRNPFRTAAIAPSSEHLAEAMLAGVDFSRVRTVVEFGPGTGVFTRAVLRRLPEGASYTALELNPRMAEELGARFPRADVHHANALDIDTVIPDQSEHGVDLIVSGLGWPSIPAKPRRDILEKTRRALAPGGRFHTFGYHIGLCMPGAWDFRARIRSLFDDVSISPVEWRNIPPAFVYRCAVRS